jgi:S-adenosylmethionine:tRNA ribosyltransferase-isomerase
MFHLDQFDYSLPDELIAQFPTEERDLCRLLVLDRETGHIEHRRFRDLVDLLDEDTVLVRNNTKVLPARLFGHKETGGKCEVLLVHQIDSANPATTTRWECLVKPGLKAGQKVLLPSPDNPKNVLVATCSADSDFDQYTRIMEFECPEDRFFSTLLELGHTPLPPYITQAPKDEQTLRKIYQTTFAKLSGSVAAPTAGLHFTPQLDEKLRQKGIQILEVTLHVGLGTFLPVQPEQIAEKRLHEEVFILSEEVASAVNSANDDGKKIITVGTTTTRVLESCAQDGVLKPQTGSTQLFIQPWDRFQIVDGLITNFHLPKSSLLMLLSAFVSAPNTSRPFTSFAESTAGKAYHAAIEEKYRFFSFGDAMLVR